MGKRRSVYVFGWGVIMGDWISVKDRLPEDDVYVLIYSPCYPKCDQMNRRLILGQFVKISTDATHWQPLPPPPVTS